ncbi:MAG: hypothetical protein M3Q31_09465 [Actinomycetota bacterium]|nr:hypothetical protein [Actinomycetota bacterium]
MVDKSKDELLEDVRAARSAYAEADGALHDAITAAVAGGCTSRSISPLAGFSHEYVRKHAAWAIAWPARKAERDAEIYAHRLRRFATGSLVRRPKPPASMTPEDVNAVDERVLNGAD